MGQRYSEIINHLKKFIEDQKIFFVGKVGDVDRFIDMKDLIASNHSLTSISVEQALRKRCTSLLGSRLGVKTQSESNPRIFLSKNA